MLRTVSSFSWWFHSAGDGAVVPHPNFSLCVSEQMKEVLVISHKEPFYLSTTPKCSLSFLRPLFFCSFLDFRQFCTVCLYIKFNYCCGCHPAHKNICPAWWSCFLTPVCFDWWYTLAHSHSYIIKKTKKKPKYIWPQFMYNSRTFNIYYFL